MEAWKEFGLNPVTHSAAHHLVAIEGLVEEYGYARVTDVAERLGITRGSASITIKSLRQRGFVATDPRGFLQLTPEGVRIVRGVRARKSVMHKLFIDVLGVEERQASIDACKIEHLISGKTVQRITRLLRFMESNRPEARGIREALALFGDHCGKDPIECELCRYDCLAMQAAEMPERSDEGSG
ncbi:MAG: metal-dependent transcriptional regulator [Candidatus Eisenbacteria bacterium]